MKLYSIRKLVCLHILRNHLAVHHCNFMESSYPTFHFQIWIYDMHEALMLLHMVLQFTKMNTEDCQISTSQSKRTDAAVLSRRCFLELFKSFPLSSDKLFKNSIVSVNPWRSPWSISKSSIHLDLVKSNMQFQLQNISLQNWMSHKNKRRYSRCCTFLCSNIFWGRTSTSFSFSFRQRVPVRNACISPRSPLKHISWDHGILQSSCTTRL